jgi:hypothetical protein
VINSDRWLEFDGLPFSKNKKMLGSKNLFCASEH